MIEPRCGRLALKHYLRHGHKRVEGWLDYTVITGLAPYWIARPQIVPFAVSPNKVFAGRPSHVAEYQVFTSLLRERFDRYDRLFAFPIDTYGVWNPMGQRASKLAQSLRRRLKRLRETYSRWLSSTPTGD